MYLLIESTHVPIDLLLLAIPALPLLAALLNGVYAWTNQIDGLQKMAGWMATLCMAGAFSCTLGLVLYGGQDVVSVAYPWLQLPGMVTLNIGLYADGAARLMALLVTLIGLLVHIYSLGYMQHDPHQNRYFACLSLFCFAMVGLVFSPNLIQLYVFWELVGVSSYLLIGFWHNRVAAARASFKAFVVNRIGDACMLGGILLAFAQGIPFDFFSILSAMPSASTAAGLLLFGGAIAKSAQFPLHVWLPDAMTGPTPVSALIHAATMVAAGVFLLLRIFPLLTTDALAVIATVGALTAFIGAISALAQFDIKRVLAYSTISQLGYMVMGMGLAAPQAGMFHLTTHAFFKCGLFLVAGIVIKLAHDAHTHHDVQDLRLMGGLRRASAPLFVAFLLMAAALVGIPFTSGALSKDALLEAALTQALESGHVLFGVVAFSAFATVLLTSYYVARLGLLLFWSDDRAGVSVTNHKPKLLLLWPVLILALLSVWIVFALNPFATQSWLQDFFGLGTSTTQSHYHWQAALVSFGMILLGSGWAWRQYRADKFLSPALQNRWWSRFSANGLFINSFYNSILVVGVQRLAGAGAKLDRIVLDGIIHGLWRIVAGRRLDNRGSLAAIAAWVDASLVDGMVRLAGATTLIAGRLLQMLQTGRLQTYLLLSLAAVVLLLLYSVL